MPNDFPSHAHATFEAYEKKDVASLCEHFHPDVTGFDADGSFLKEGIDPEVMKRQLRIGEHRLQLRHFESRDFGDARIGTGYVEAVSRIRDTVHVEQSWRYTEVRINENGKWLLVHYHFSPFREPIIL